MYVQYDIYGPRCVVSQYVHQSSPQSIYTIIVVRDCIVELGVILGPIFFIEISEQNLCSVRHLWILMCGQPIRSPKLSIVHLYNHRSEGLHCLACSTFMTDISSNVYRKFGGKCMFSTTFMDLDVWLANTSTKTLHSPSVQSSQ